MSELDTHGLFFFHEYNHKADSHRRPYEAGEHFLLAPLPPLTTGSVEESQLSKKMERDEKSDLFHKGQRANSLIHNGLHRHFFGGPDMNPLVLHHAYFFRLTLALVLTTILSAVWSLPHALGQEEADPAEITNGERLFLETRFAQFFKVFLDNGGDVNNPLPQGDPALDKVVNSKIPPDQFADSPFAGQSMNCRSCHFVDELGIEEPLAGYGMRTYTDFARRSPVPAREDGKTVTVRNSPPLVNASLPRKNFFLHFDAEFATMVDLVKGTLTGRNYGWLPNEQAEAIAHIAKVVREDNGQGDLAQEFGSLSYTVLLTGTDPTIPEEFLLPEEFRVEVVNATDEQIFLAVAQLISAYTEDLAFSQDEDGNFNLSPYDVFLEKNDLPRQPRKRESDLRYSQRLLFLIKLREWSGQLEYVTENPNTENSGFQFHDQPFVFGEEELKGLKIFFSQKFRRLRPSDLAKGEVGNCVSCHAAPNFTDFKFHNTGIAQAEYDGIHGPGTFAKIEIPGLGKRKNNPNEYLPATSQHSDAKEPFRSIPSIDNAQLTDLGLWNIFANPDFRKPQLKLWLMLCKDQLGGFKHFFKIFKRCRPSALLPKTIALFKTPGLRDLGHSPPFSHTGQVDTLEGVIKGYIGNSQKTRDGELRNGDHRLKEIALLERDIVPLVAFLKSLNEDYE